MTPYRNGWLNGWNFDIDVYVFQGRVFFRIWRHRQWNVGVFSQTTLGM